MVKQVLTEPIGKEFYLPHRPVIRGAESVKVRIVFDVTGREDDSSPSLNNCLEVGSPLQNYLWNVLLKNSVSPIALAGDMKQVFLQIQIQEEDCDPLQFHWVVNKDTDEIETLQFTRVIFGLGELLFLLAGTAEEHSNNSKEKYPELQKELNGWLHESLYVDDIITGGKSMGEVKELRDTAIKIFWESGIELHKWHSNVAELETEETQSNSINRTYTKEQFRVKPQWIKDTRNVLGQTCRYTWNRYKERKLRTNKKRYAEEPSFYIWSPWFSFSSYIVWETTL